LRIVNFRSGQALRLGALHGESVFDLQELSAAAGKAAPFLSSAADFLNAGSEALDLALKLLADAPVGQASFPLKSLQLGPPVPKPSKIIAVELNYRDHAVKRISKCRNIRLYSQNFRIPSQGRTIPS
jgi:2-keto-4-pentenoate hydratase/2-oxohepta-3-ene-1,7-dioic acid hydratase in catechol pathway